MTVPGLLEKADDKEKLVVKTDVATIMPKRDRLIKVKKRRHILRLIISLALLLLSLSTIFLTICYIKKIGPFKRIFRAICPVGEERNGHRKIYESLELTDDYVLINVPKFHAKYGIFQSAKTLHVFKKQLIVIQYNGMCFVRPMIERQGFHKNWYEKIGHYNPGQVPSKFTHVHWRLSHQPLSHDFLQKNVHNMAAAMCISRPVFNLKYYRNSRSLQLPCTKKCDNCPLNRQFMKWEFVYGQRCKVCHCQEVVKPSNCKSIRCDNKCKGKKLAKCVHCICDDSVKVMATGVPIFQNQERVFRKQVVQTGDAPTALPIFQDQSNQHRIYWNKETSRKKRSTSKNCKIIAEIFEGYNPLDRGLDPPVDYIHDC